MGKINNIGSFTLTTTGGPNSNGVYTISQADGISRMGLELSSGGAATFQGSANINALGGISTAIAITPQVPLLISTNNENEFIDTVVITVTSGTITVVLGQ